jgi:hypothetical protein
VPKLIDLLINFGLDLGVAMAHVHDSYSSHKIDIPFTIHIPDLRPKGMIDHERVFAGIRWR